MTCILWWLSLQSPLMGAQILSLSWIKRFLGNTTFQQTLEQCPLCKPYSFMSQTWPEMGKITQKAGGRMRCAPREKCCSILFKSQSQSLFMNCFNWLTGILFKHSTACNHASQILCFVTNWKFMVTMLWTCLWHGFPNIMYSLGIPIPHIVNSLNIINSFLILFLMVLWSVVFVTIVTVLHL